MATMTVHMVEVTVRSVRVTTQMVVEDLVAMAIETATAVQFVVLLIMIPMPSIARRNRLNTKSNLWIRVNRFV